MAGYTKELIIDVFLDRFVSAVPPFSPKVIKELQDMAENYYEKVGKDVFRKYASVTPEAIKLYKGKQK